MLQCQQCGAELRAGARFCNRCGAVQLPPAGTQSAGQSSRTDQAASVGSAQQPRATQVPAPDVPTTAPDVNGSAAAADEAARAKRPPRVQRVREEDEAEPPAVSVNQPAPVQGMAAQGAAATAASAQERAQPEPPSAGAAPAKPGQAGVREQEMPALVAADEAAAPSATQATTPAQGSAPTATAQPAAPGPNEEPPWPLAPGAILGGRYRVESVVTLAPTPTDETVYRVTDRLGYEHCWSCGATYQVSSDQPPEQFCAQCGADMLARPYLMRERLLSAVEAQAPVATAEAATGVRTFREGGRQFSVAPEEIERAAFPLGAHIVMAAASDIGRERSAEANEDSVGQLVVQIEHESRAEPLALGIVADGLGGHASGSEASRTVVNTVQAYVMRELVVPAAAGTGTRPTEEAIKRVLREGITAANATLHAANAESHRDMGSTIVAALIAGETAYIANVGDSRAYVLDGAQLRRLTADHSLVEQLVAGGMISPEERYTHPSRNQIYRSLGVGSGDELVVDLFTQRLRPGMRLLLCSDGLWEMVHDDELGRILYETPHPQGVCDTLVRAANAHGGEDNISALVIDITG